VDPDPRGPSACDACRRLNDPVEAGLRAENKQLRETIARLAIDCATLTSRDAESEQLRTVVDLARAVVDERQPALRHARETAAMCKLEKALRELPKP
jgi:hypothetical protein